MEDYEKKTKCNPQQLSEAIIYLFNQSKMKGNHLKLVTQLLGLFACQIQTIGEALKHEVMF